MGRTSRSAVVGMPALAGLVCLGCTPQVGPAAPGPAASSIPRSATETDAGRPPHETADYATVLKEVNAVSARLVHACIDDGVFPAPGAFSASTIPPPLTNRWLAECLRARRQQIERVRSSGYAPTDSVRTRAAWQADLLSRCALGAPWSEIVQRVAQRPPDLRPQEVVEIEERCRRASENCLSENACPGN
jgi:hypothetical protein